MYLGYKNLGQFMLDPLIIGLLKKMWVQYMYVPQSQKQGSNYGQPHFNYWIKKIMINIRFDPMIKGRGS